MKIELLENGKPLPRECSSCLDEMPTPVCEIGGAPAVLGVSPNSSVEEDRFIDFYVYVCPHCGLIQTDAEFDPDWYGEVHSHGVGRIWTEHRRELIAFAKSAISERGTGVSRALEIGPSVNPVAKGLALDGTEVYYLDLMPEPPFDLGPNETYISGAFPSDETRGPFDLVIASHVLEHAEVVSEFFRQVRDRLSAEGIAVLSTPNFRVWIGEKYWNAITSEHLNYPDVEHLTDMSNRSDMDAAIGYFKEHSVFISLRRRRAKPDETHPVPEAVRRECGRALTAWVSEVSSSVRGYEEAIGSDPGPVLLAGASHLSQYTYLLSAALRPRVEAVLDNAAEKHGKRLYGTSVTARPFDVVADFDQPTVIVPRSPYVREMTDQVMRLNPSARVLS